MSYSDDYGYNNCVRGRPHGSKLYPRRVHVNLTNELVEIAKHLGDGNISNGIREALEQTKEKVVREAISMLKRKG